MNTMVHVAITLLTLAATLFVIRSLRAAYRKNPSGMFADLSVAFFLVFAVSVLVGVGTATGALLVHSPTVFVLIWVLAGMGCVNLVLAMFIKAWVRSVQSWTVRHTERQAKRLDKKLLRGRKNQEATDAFFDKVSGGTPED